MVICTHHGCIRDLFLLGQLMLVENAEYYKIPLSKPSFGKWASFHIMGNIEVIWLLVLGLTKACAITQKVVCDTSYHRTTMADNLTINPFLRNDTQGGRNVGRLHSTDNAVADFWVIAYISSSHGASAFRYTPICWRTNVSLELQKHRFWLSSVINSCPYHVISYGMSSIPVDR